MAPLLPNGVLLSAAVSAASVLAMSDMLVRALPCRAYMWVGVWATGVAPLPNLIHPAFSPRYSADLHCRTLFSTTDAMGGILVVVAGRLQNDYYCFYSTSTVAQPVFSTRCSAHLHRRCSCCATACAAPLCLFPRVAAILASPAR